MATTNIELGAITSRISSPYKTIANTIAGNDTLRITAGKVFDIPSVWSLTAAYIVVSTDATVANRIIQLYSGTELWPVVYALGTAITASSTGALQIAQFSDLDDMFTTQTHKIGTREDFMTISGEEVVDLSLGNGVAGDSMSFRFNFKYRNWDLGMADYYARWAPPVINPKGW